MYTSQNNTQAGVIPFIAAAALTGKEGLLAKLTNNSGVTEAALPAAAADYTPFVIVSGAALGGNAYLQPIEPNQNVRLRLNGTCVAGDLIVREDETGAETGKVRKLPAGAGTYSIVGIAEEGGVDEQLLLIRPHKLGDTITVV